uniref:NADH dehydrogenase subunit 2 n=1 Tax=Grandidierella taihuensis TaxID=2778875 RepID=UPI001BEDFC65|nr:NADH dehydrogenase subunit 2 [Grandidierella taihuensis]QTX95222.1 NADH dehydrogenase subunit 2 [Grandidierella taihuensis]
MILHPANMLFFSTLLLTIVLIMSTDSWLVTWMALEINVMVFLPIMLKKNNKYQSETALKYFITQVIASILILLALVQLKTLYSFSCYILITALMLKLAAAPLHKWMPALINGLNWESLFMLLVIQKAGPFIILSMNNPCNNFENFTKFFIISSALIGAIMALFQSSLQKMLAYSSIAHLSWMLSLILLNKLDWVTYFIIYSLITLTLMISLSMTNMLYLSQMMTNSMNNINKVWVMFGFLSLAGLPPFTGFFPKMMSMELLTQSPHNLLLLPLLMSSLISLFLYLRITLNSMFFKTSQPFSKPVNNKNTLMTFINLTGLFTGVLLFI